MQLKQNEERLAVPKLIEWLEKQTPEGTYTYCFNDGCLIYRYLKSQNIPVKSVSPTFITLEDGQRIVYHKSLDQIAQGKSPTAWSYGDALKRAKEMENSQ